MHLSFELTVLQSKLVVLKSLANFLARAMTSKDPIRFNDNGEETPTQLRRTSTWFMASAFASPSAFTAFEKSILPSISMLGSSPARSWKEECFPDDGHENFLGPFSLLVDESIESWSFDSLSHLEQIPVMENRESAGSSSGIKAESAYIFVGVSYLLIVAQSH